MKLIPIVVASTALFAGCGSSGSSAEPMRTATAASATTAIATARTHGPKLKIVSSDYGRILANGRGRALYLFTADRGKGSNCSGDCATAWPPYIVKSKPIAAPGVTPGLIGITKRDDGRLQATYAGHPVYFYEGDHDPGQVLCQAVDEFGGYWYVLHSHGRPVR